MKILFFTLFILMYTRQQLESMKAPEVLQIAMDRQLKYFTYKQGLSKSKGKRNKSKTKLINLILTTPAEQINISEPYKAPTALKTKIKSKTKQKKIKTITKMTTGQPGAGKRKIKRRYVIDVDAYVTKRKK